MSKIGKQPIVLPDGVTASATPAAVEVKGKLGTLSVPVLPFIIVAVKDGAVVCSRNVESIQSSANWGTMRALIANAVIGVSSGYTKTLQIEGIGFRATLEGKTLVLAVGFTHPVRFTPPVGVTLVLTKNLITISGIDKFAVGEAAARIRAIRKPEPYQGKGIRYQGEVVRRKEGKKVAGAGATA